MSGSSLFHTLSARFTRVSGTSVPAHVAFLFPYGRPAHFTDKWRGSVHCHVGQVGPSAGAGAPAGNRPVCVLQNTPSPCTTPKPVSSDGTPPTSTTQPRCLRTTGTTVSVPGRLPKAGGVRVTTEDAVTPKCRVFF